jgi:hypothetical protein
VSSVKHVGNGKLYFSCLFVYLRSRDLPFLLSSSFRFSIKSFLLLLAIAQHTSASITFTQQWDKKKLATRYGGACENAIYPEAVFVQDRCAFPTGIIQEGVYNPPLKWTRGVHFYDEALDRVLCLSHLIPIYLRLLLMLLNERFVCLMSLLRVIGVIWILYPVVPIRSRHSMILWLLWTMGLAHISATVKINFSISPERFHWSHSNQSWHVLHGQRKVLNNGHTCANGLHIRSFTNPIP